MALILDTFWGELQTQLVSQGWSIVWGYRYDPTHLEGFTPTGRSFVLDIVIDTPDGQPHDNDVATVTLDIAGRIRSFTTTRSQVESGDLSVSAMAQARNRFPANQR